MTERRSNAIPYVRSSSGLITIVVITLFAIVMLLTPPIPNTEIRKSSQDYSPQSTHSVFGIWIILTEKLFVSDV